MTIPPAIKQYIDQAISDLKSDTDILVKTSAQSVEAALSQGMRKIVNSRIDALRNELMQSIAEVSQQASIKTGNAQLIAPQVAGIIEASIASSVSAIASSKADALRQELDEKIAVISDSIAKSEVAFDRSLQAVADLNAKLTHYMAKDRYELTRAQVSRIMKEQKKKNV
jgi:hypothetical protein